MLGFRVGDLLRRDCLFAVYMQVTLAPCGYRPWLAQSHENIGRPLAAVFSKAGMCFLTDAENHCVLRMNVFSSPPAVQVR